MIDTVISAGGLVYLIIAAACSFVWRILNTRINELKAEVKEEREHRINNVVKVHEKIEAKGDALAADIKKNGERVAKVEGKLEK